MAITKRNYKLLKYALVKKSDFNLKGRVVGYFSTQFEANYQKEKRERLLTAFEKIGNPKFSVRKLTKKELKEIEYNVS